MTTDLIADLREMVAMLLGADLDAIDEKDNFADLGIDSLMRLEIIAFVEQSIGQEIPEENLPDLGNIQEVISYVDSRDSEQ